MSCPPIDRIATLDDDVVAHATSCDACAELVAGQREIRDALAGLAAPVLPRPQRDSLAAEVMARADALPPSRKLRIVPIAAAVLAAAAAAVFVIVLRAPSTAPVPPPHDPSVAIAPKEPPVVQHEDPPPPSLPVVAPASAKVAGTGDYERTGDLVKLAAGEVDVDATGPRGVSVRHGDTTVAVRGARVKVIEKRGVIAQVHVFAGSAEIIVGGKTVIVEAGTIWDRNGAREDSLAAFRTGWEQLRGGDNAAAIASFDRATDEAVAEDAAYWAAVAADRLGRKDEALARFRAFVLGYSKSPRASDATAAIARLTP